jgi:hypothetical protein
MPRWRILNDIYVGGIYYTAGELVDLPREWVPTGAVEPLDNDALDAFYAAGPQQPDLIRPRWTNDNAQLPRTYWRQIPGSPRWTLTGLGVDLPHKEMAR